MSLSDFRNIAFRRASKKADRLLRAAVSAFCSLTRPSRRDAAQLEDLALPLFEQVSAESLRYIAAALSECDHAPAALVRRLCDQSVDVAAPLLIRSRALSDIDLIALIGRHGLGHARAIARRPALNPTIAGLVQALDRKVVPLRAVPAAAERPAGPPLPQQPAPEPARFDAAEDARRRLREMMRRDPETVAIRPLADPYASLLRTALTGNPALFHTALADALGIDFATARMVSEGSFSGSLIAALRALDLREDQAFLLAAAVQPSRHSSAEAIRLFVERYRKLDREAALARVACWKPRRSLPPAAAPSPVSNDAGPAMRPDRIRAS